MSELYVSQPLTSGKVVLHTSLGPFDIELWSKECPLAVRNFIQLCLEKYYDGTEFHRIVKGFMMQGGDPTGTGTGGESIYGGPFQDEFHSRIKFSHRGLVAMANSGPNTNQSQFFITFDKCDYLTKKHTIFGKITGDSIFNFLPAADIEVDSEDRPIYVAPKIISTEVLYNPFDDIVPRAKKVEPVKKVEAPQVKIKKNTSLLSFGDAEEEDESVSIKVKKGSAHDFCTEDPTLAPALAPVDGVKAARAKLSKPQTVVNANVASLISKSTIMPKNIVSEKNEAKKSPSRSRSRSSSRSRSYSRSKSRSRSVSPEDPGNDFIKSRRLKLDEMKQSQKRNRVNISRGLEHDEELMTDLERRRSKYVKKKKLTKDRESRTLEKLNLFKESLHASHEPDYLKGKLDPAKKVPTEPSGEDDENWKTHRVKFVHRPSDFDPMAKDQDRYEYVSFDPRKAHMK